MAMNDPSSGVPPPLLRHIHLVCNQGFPVMPRTDMDTLVRYLHEAPRLVRDKASMTWMAFIEPPRDGAVILVWQPRNAVAFPSDGYIWLDAERSRSQSLGGYNLEVHAVQSGYRPGFENFTTHARRRYRFTPSRDAPPNMPSVDPCLWLVHYFQTEAPNQIPASGAPLSDAARQMVAERNALQGRGQLQLQRNEFMLHDRNKWPSINLPGVSMSSYSQQAMGYPNNVMAQMSRSQHPAYGQNPQLAMSQGPMGQPVAKRARHSSMNAPTSTTALAPSFMSRDYNLNDEETSASVDYMDMMTPREISALRFTQHHEWFEEILNSPYETYQIIPGELGLGRKGELESLTRDFFTAYTSQKIGRDLQYPGTPHKKNYEEGSAVVPDDPVPRVGRMGDSKFEDFQAKAAERMGELQREMDDMKAQHAQRMDALKLGQVWASAEQDLRAVTSSILNDGPAPAEQAHVEKLVQSLEENVGRKIGSLKLVDCVQKGGLEEKNLDIPHQRQAASIDGEGNEDESSAKEEHLENGSTSPSPEAPSGEQVPDQPKSVASPKPSTTGAEASTSNDNRQNPDDWVMVDKDNEAEAGQEEETALDAFTSDATMHMEESLDVPVPDGNTVNDELNFGDTEFDGGLELSDFNTAGPELADYAQEIEGMTSGDGHAEAVEGLVEQPNTSAEQKPQSHEGTGS